MNKKSRPLRKALNLLLRFMDLEERENFKEYVDSVHKELLLARGLRTARIWFWRQFIRSLPRLVIKSIEGDVVMLRNYLKTALRNLKVQRLYSAINIAGLAVGISCCILIFLYVSFELSYDDYHPHSDRLYRIVMNAKAVNLTTNAIGYNWDTVHTPIPMGASIMQNFPQVEKMARLDYDSNILVKHGETRFYEQECLYADQAILDIFSIKFLQGNPEIALTNPGTVVLTQRTAEKYFGRENPLGKLININDKDFEITGVVENCPLNTQLEYDLLISFQSKYDDAYLKNTGWINYHLETYIRLREGTDPKEMEERFNKLWGTVRGFGGYSTTHKYFLEPVSDIHLEPTFGSHTRLRYLYIFAAIGILILSIACINFINLVTARSASRAKEIGVRKVIGAFRGQLIRQFLSESLLMTLCAFMASIPLAAVLLPAFNNLAGTGFNYSDLLQPGAILLLSGFAVLVGMASGFYPAFFLSNFKPVSALKGWFEGGSKNNSLRRVLVVGQFTVSIILIISTAFVYRQLHFMKNKHLGFDKEQKLVVPIKRDGKHEIYKSEFLKHPAISGVTASSDVPSSGTSGNMTRLYGHEDEKEQMVHYFYVDTDFIPEYNITLLAGRMFKENEASSSSLKCLINETALHSFGWEYPEQAIGEKILSIDINNFGTPVEIIGIIKDFHYKSLQNQIEPVALGIFYRFLGYPTIGYLTMTVNTENITETLKFVEKRWKELFPGDAYRYFFLDSQFDSLYRSEENLGKIFTSFTLLAILISCFGLFGLAAFMAQNRTKEIGIRKVLGASITSIAMMLSQEFTKWVVISSIISWPVAYFVMSQWLQNFAYRISMGLWIFILSSLGALILAIFTVSFQSIKAATANPVDSLRYE